MKLFAACLVTLTLLSSKVRSNEVEVAGDRTDPLADHLLQVVQLKLDELFVESSEQFELLQTELYHLRQSVEHVAWLTSRVEQAVQKVQLDNDVLLRNVTMLTSQTDHIILNQQYCANHEALKNLFFDLTPKCLDNQAVRPPSIPSTPTTTEVSEATSTTEPATTTTTTTEAAEAETTTSLPTTGDTSEEDFNVYARCSLAPPRSGVYWLQRQDGTVFRAFCEQERFGGGLLVFQSRLDGSVDFNRSWSEFVEGFGDPAGEYWLGLETLHQAAPNATELVVAMKNFSDFEAYEKYSSFWIDPASFNYRIRFTAQGTGTAGDSLYYYYGEHFLTYDHISNINWKNCLYSLGSGFWHFGCDLQIGRNNLNGIYGLDKGQQGIWWGAFGDSVVQNTSPLKTVQMMVRY